MKRISITIVVTLVTLALALLIYAQKQKSPSGQTAEINSNTASEDQVQKLKGKLLVKKLPSGIEGVMLKEGVVTAKPGYQFVTGEDGTVRVALVKGGGGPSDTGGSFNCSCDGGQGGCSPATVSATLSCIKNPTDACKGVCTLTVIFKGVTNRIMAYK
jgi:hypothetical protein